MTTEKDTTMTVNYSIFSNGKWEAGSFTAPNMDAAEIWCSSMAAAHGDNFTYSF